MEQSTNRVFSANDAGYHSDENDLPVSVMYRFLTGSPSSTSSYKRIQRFFRSYSFCLDAIARLTVSLLPLEGQWMLCLDRTNWILGKKEINLLALVFAWCYATGLKQKMIRPVRQAKTRFSRQ